MRAVMLTPLVAFLAACSGAAPSALAERVQALEDKREIREVLVRYGEYLDAREYALYASLFAADGTATTGFGSATGPAAIKALLEQALGRPDRDYINKDRFHLMTTTLAHVDGGEAEAASRYTVFAAGPDGRPSPVHSGRYADRLIRENGAWKIVTRTSHGVIPYREPPSAAAR